MSVAPETMPMPEAPGDRSNWEYTSKAEDIARLRQEVEQMGGRVMRHSIGRDMPVTEGVYEGSYGGEAIIVDYAKDPTLIDGVVREVLVGAVDPKTGRPDKSSILEGVFNKVSASMRYDAAAVDTMFKVGLRGKEHQKVSLSAYIGAGVGVCRHQALYAAAVLEQIKSAGYIRGNVSVDRNMVRRSADLDDKYDGHAWTRYTNSAGQVFILDVAQGRIGSLDELMDAHEQDPRSTWDYGRPEDHARRRAERQVIQAYAEPTKQFDLRDYTDENGVINRVPWE